MDKSLDEGTRRGTGRRGGAGAKAQLLGTTGANPATARPLPALLKPQAPHLRNPPIKSLVSLRDVTLHYDSAGPVHFQRKGDGTLAYQQYNNRLIDGNRNRGRPPHVLLRPLHSCRASAPAASAPAAPDARSARCVH
ncbi:uncharacterized protein BJ212DRAFT_1411882 [Suillus subaureus]|uniref:Uncharacterized protein n=1 Tax=Suillus subaureus TaxID=48587 RepID=A0A9P7AT52_9AGAM|nr:uncharacterized protein BJ212DRAFT_1411882 [Suillus subaureus]KAG1794949.1 hypothetical protein BJ212DRAFT_1411882 [Suillus subaureus]